MDVEAGGLDRLDVAAARDRAGDARDSEFDVAPGVLPRRLAADDVREASRPRGRSTRTATAKTRLLMKDSLITPLEITASNIASSNGSLSM